jgi:hypothetical protein
MKGYATVPVLCTAGLSGWIDSAANRIIQSAARRAPSSLSERLEEEWLAAIPEQRGRLRRLSFALGCCWAAMAIRRDHFGDLLSNWRQDHGGLCVPRNLFLLP